MHRHTASKIEEQSVCRIRYWYLGLAQAYCATNLPYHDVIQIYVHITYALVHY